MAQIQIDGAQHSNVLQLISFFLDNAEYALPITQVQEINRLSEITQIPSAPFHILGVINLRGQIVPVMELKRRLNIGEVNRGDDARIIVVEVGTKTMGLMDHGTDGRPRCPGAPSSRIVHRSTSRRSVARARSIHSWSRQTWKSDDFGFER
jgi:chemotaxis signal transduction protein